LDSACSLDFPGDPENIRFYARPLNAAAHLLNQPLKQRFGRFFEQHAEVGKAASRHFADGQSVNEFISGESFPKADAGRSACHRDEIGRPSRFPCHAFPSGQA
jgi:hypothetical protein